MKRFQLIDLVRGICIFWVLTAHLKALCEGLSPESNLFPLRMAWHLFSHNGSYGVTLFFLISGFLITGLLASDPGGLFRPSLKDFYIRRAARILPLLTAVLLIGTVFLFWNPIPSQAYGACMKDPHGKFDLGFFLSITTFSFNWHRIQAESTATSWGSHWDVLWSLSIEEQFYLFFPILLTLLKSEKKLKTFLAFVIILGPLSRWIAYLIKPDSFIFSFTNSFAAFDQIAMGSFLYLVSTRKSKSQPENKNWRLFLFGLALTAGIYTLTGLSNGLDRIYGPSLIACGLFLLLLGGLQLPFFQKPFWNYLALPGKLSYGGYLLHSVVLYLLFPILKQQSIIAAFFLFASTTTLLAWFSYQFFEKPANSMVRKILGRPPGKSAT